MRTLLQLALLFAVLVSAVADDPRAKQTIQAKAYHVISHRLENPRPPAQVIGRIPQAEHIEIQVTADSMSAAKSIILTGNAQVVVLSHGKPIATYEGQELVLTPLEIAATPLTYEEIWKKLPEFDAALARRDVATVLGFLADDAKITAAYLSTGRVETRALTKEDLGEYIAKQMFPGALRLRVDERAIAQAARSHEEPLGTYLTIAKDGVSASGRSNVRMLVAFPEGEVAWDILRNMSVERRGERFVITSLETRLSQSVTENWPQPQIPPTVPGSGIIRPR